MPSKGSAALSVCWRSKPISACVCLRYSRRGCSNRGFGCRWFQQCARHQMGRVGIRFSRRSVFWPHRTAHPARLPAGGRNKGACVGRWGRSVSGPSSEPLPPRGTRSRQWPHHAPRVQFARARQRDGLIKRGQAMAEVGSTGRSTGAHLHFGMPIDCVFQDPTKFLAVAESALAAVARRMRATRRPPSATGANVKVRDVWHAAPTTESLIRAAKGRVSAFRSARGSFVRCRRKPIRARCPAAVPPFPQPQTPHVAQASHLDFR